MLWEIWQRWGNGLLGSDGVAALLGATTSFALIVTAEIGDKSQLVCMTLAARHRGWPIWWGAVVSFALLNGLAVVFGLALASALPRYLSAALVSLLFLLFGFHALRAGRDEDAPDAPPPTNHGLFLTTFLLITVAEFGDKTQLAVVALSSLHAAFAVWLGATLALAFTSALGVWAGRALLQKLPLVWLHRFSGVVFLALACLAAREAAQTFPDWARWWQ